MSCSSDIVLVYFMNIVFVIDESKSSKRYVNALEHLFPKDTLLLGLHDYSFSISLSSFSSISSIGIGVREGFKNFPTEPYPRVTITSSSSPNIFNVAAAIRAMHSLVAMVNRLYFFTRSVLPSLSNPAFWTKRFW